MQQPDEHTLEHTRKIYVAPYVLFVASVIMTFFGIFVLGTLAHHSGLVHASQHLFIFLGGATAGISVYSTRKSKKDN
jgi:hypothetical protein